MGNFKSGFIAIIGRTNVGKSTLLNTLVGEKVAITTYKTQTTRTAIRAILNRKNSQLIFVDTPGIHRPKTKLRANNGRGRMEYNRQFRNCIIYGTSNIKNYKR